MRNALALMMSLAAFPHPCSRGEGGGEGGGAAGFDVPMQKPEAGIPIGIAECDAYIERYEGCIQKLPPAKKAPLLATFDTQRNVYREQAKTVEKSQLAKGCQAALDALRETCP